MPQRTNDFQNVIHAIYRALAPINSDPQPSAMIADLMTGKLREVDTLIRGELVGEPITVAVEARNHKRPQSVEWIDSLIGKYANLPVDKIIAVSSSGFRPNALDKARLHGICCLTPEQAANVDWASELSKAWSILTHTHQICRLSSHDPSGRVVTFSSLDDDTLTHQDDASRRAYPELHNYFMARRRGQIGASIWRRRYGPC